MGVHIRFGTPNLLAKCMSPGPCLDTVQVLGVTITNQLTLDCKWSARNLEFSLFETSLANTNGLGSSILPPLVFFRLLRWVKDQTPGRQIAFALQRPCGLTTGRMLW